MKYKQIILKNDLRGNFKFITCVLPHERNDDGEYVWAGVTANIYAGSDDTIWKKKLIEIQKDQALAEIEKLSLFIENIDCFSRSL